MGCNFSNMKPEKDREKKNSISRYKLEKVIGRGGFSRVWSATDKLTKEKVAIKVMSKAKIFDRNSVQCILNELDLHKKIKHPFILSIRGAFQDKENLYLVMDYLTGGDVRYHMQSKVKFNESQAKFIISCLVLALEYLHMNKIIHRDLKPENLIFDSHGYIYLSDFGIAKRFTENKVCMDTSGTPGYMAPEVVYKINHTYPADYFSLGVILYEIMFLKRPYKSSSRNDLKSEILSHQVFIHPDKIPKGWSKESADFVNKLLNRKISDRLGSRGIYEIKLHPWFDGIDFNKLYDKNQCEPKFIPVSEENYNLKNVSKKEPPIKDADLMTNLVNKKSELELYYFDPNDKKSFSSIFKRNDFIPIDPSQSEQRISPLNGLENKLSLKENNSCTDISSNIPSSSLKQYAMSYCSNLSSKKITRSLAIKSESKNN